MKFKLTLNYQDTILLLQTDAHNYKIIVILKQLKFKLTLNYQDTILLLQTDAHNYKVIGILKQLKFRLLLRHVSIHTGTIIRELFRA